MSKLDPTLRSYVELSQERRRAQLLEEGTSQGDSEEIELPTPPPEVELVVIFTGDIEDLKQVDFEPRTILPDPTEGFTIVTGSIPVARLEDLANIPHVTQIEGSRPFKPELDNSVPDIQADKLHDTAIPIKGKNVVVGVIDSGIDYRHKVFRKPDNKTRILALWDQSLQPEGGEKNPAALHPAVFPRFNFGVEYTEAKINEALAQDDPLDVVRSKDETGHGTQVAAIAAGDGSQAGNCEGANTFIGVAPEADLIIVKVRGLGNRIGESQSLIDAFEFIFSHPSAAGRAVVINFSDGDNLGAHDGSSAVEKALDTFLKTSQRAVVKSAGNEGECKHHAEGSIPKGNGFNLEYEVQSGDSKIRSLELWYKGGNTLTATVHVPNSQNAVGPVNPGANKTQVVNKTIVNIFSDQNPNQHPDNRIFVQMIPMGKGKLAAGTWKLQLDNPGPAAVTFNAWIERDESCKGTPAFTSHGSADNTVTIPGTAQRVISVGSYATEGQNKGKLSVFSSRGPGFGPDPKPTIAAPGEGITSARANSPGLLTRIILHIPVIRLCCCECCQDRYTDASGTSLSAPHVTGTVALMFQKNSTLSADQIKTILAQNVRKDEFTGNPPNRNEWGAGKLNAFAAFGATPKPGNPFDGGGESPSALVGEPKTRTKVKRTGSPSPSREFNSQPDPGLCFLSGNRSLNFTQLRRAVLQTPMGHSYAALLSKHFSEVRGLINTNRRVATVWHRIEGPRLLRLLLEAAGEPGAHLPPEIDPTLLSQRLKRFSDILARYGSQELQSDIQRCQPVILALEWAGPNELVEAFSRQTAQVGR